MLRRSFSLLPRALKNKDIGAVKKALKYITEDQPLSSLLQRRKSGEESKYVQDVVEILNASLPNVAKHQKSMDVHYSVLMNKLRGMVDKEVTYATVDVNKRISDCQDSDSLFNLIWELQMDPLLREKATLKHYYHIINSPLFSTEKCVELLDCKDLLKQFKTDIQIMAIYKLNDAQVVSKYLCRLVQKYPDLNQFSQKLTLRILQRADKLQNLLNTQHERIHTIEKNHSQVVMIFQTLYHNAYKLPEQLLEESTELTQLQHAFCSTVRLLSEYRSVNPRFAKYCSQLVKASFVNKLSQCNTVQDHSINISEYKFFKYLDEVLEACMTLSGPEDSFHHSCRTILLAMRKTYNDEAELSLRLV